MKDLRILLVIALIPLFAFQCGDKMDGGHKYIIFKNNSENNVYISNKRLIKIEPSDTLYDCNDREIEITQGVCGQIEAMNNYWETDFNAIPYIQFFVYPKRTSAYESCEEARKYQLKRYQLTKEDLDNMNWIVTYP